MKNPPSKSRQKTYSRGVYYYWHRKNCYAYPLTYSIRVYCVKPYWEAKGLL